MIVTSGVMYMYTRQTFYDSISGCHMTCHPKCVPEMPDNCGLSTEYIHYFSQIMWPDSISGCHMICHPKCVPEMPDNCGLSTEYIHYFSQIMDQLIHQPKKFSIIDGNNPLKQQGWLKVQRSVVQERLKLQYSRFHLIWYRLLWYFG